jgi:uncharacterized membrane protein SpoIIM required for sporulation
VLELQLACNYKIDKTILLCCCIVFLIGTIIGFTYDSFYSEGRNNSNLYKEINNGDLFIIIFTNNLTVILINIFGMFSCGLLSVVSLFYNGFVFSYFLKSYINVLGLVKCACVTMPHSIELAAIVFSAYIGVKVGLELWHHIFLGKELQLNYKLILTEVVLCVIVIFVAAFIESYISIKI